MIYTAILNKSEQMTIEDILLIPGVHSLYEHRWFFNINVDQSMLINNDINNHEDILWDIIETIIRGNIMNMPHIQSVGTLAQLPKDPKKAKEFKKLYGKQL